MNGQDDRVLKAVLAGLQTTEEEARFERSLAELAGLCEACGVEAVSVLTQRAPHPEHATYLGSGKVQELKALMYAVRADLVIFDKSLSPIQVRNLGRILEKEVIDRTDLILRIFSERARTKEAKLQVEYAHLSYLLPRLVGMRENLSRQGGASGFQSARGAGETQLELDRRKILNRQAQLRRELKEVGRVQDTQREGRSASGLSRIGLVGYTNAGKSTLMNRLIALSAPAPSDTKEKNVFAEDMLFATLDTTVRKIAIRGRTPFLLSDTVGFISDLPAPLIEAFRSTLAEAAEADLLLEVADCTDEDLDAQTQTTLQTLKDIGAGRVPRIRVMNKADLLPASAPKPGTLRRRGGLSGTDEVFVSAATGEGTDALLDLIEETLTGSPVEITLLLPYRDGDITQHILETMNVLEQSYRADGTLLTVRCGRRLAEKYSSYQL